MSKTQAEVIATNGYFGVSLGPGWPPVETPQFLVAAPRSLMITGWRTAFWDGVTVNALGDFQSKADAVDFACSHAESLRYPVVLVEAPS